MSAFIASGIPLIDSVTLAILPQPTILPTRLLYAALTETPRWLIPVSTAPVTLTNDSHATILVSLIVFSRTASVQATMRRQERSRVPTESRRRPEDLTPREQQILGLIWSGLKNREIATRLKISVKTVEAHRATMMKKVRVSNTAQLLKAAIQDRLIKIG
jgi:DNA-binding CsgD family transcriptional regulator